jgi:hypothetical protein
MILTQHLCIHLGIGDAMIEHFVNILRDLFMVQIE